MSGTPHVRLISTGGTIAGRPGEGGASLPSMSAADLLPEDAAGGSGARLTTLDAGRMPSRRTSPGDMNRLAHLVERSVAEGCDGVVITHGTDTLEETAYALALQLRPVVPVVLTGAMRLPHEPGADGPANLRSAIRVASGGDAVARLGPVVVMNDEIHAARWVTKTHTSSVAAFASPGWGPVGRLAEGRVQVHGPEAQSDHLGLPDGLPHRVELLWVASGADGLLADRAAEVADGLVVAGTGGGHMPPEMSRSVAAGVARGVHAVLASRCGNGKVLEETYAGEGSETHLLGIGMLPAGDLAPLKARLRLLVALALGVDPGEAFPA